MILIVTNKTDYTADFLILELQKRNKEFYRFNTEDFPEKIQLTFNISNTGTEVELQSENKNFFLSEVESAWFRRPVTPGIALPNQREQRFAINESIATLEGIWQSLDCFWVSRPERLRVAEKKIWQLVNAQKIGFTLSRTMVTNDPQAGFGFAESNDFDVVYKTLESARISENDDLGLIFTSSIRTTPKENYAAISLSPVLLQRRIKKKVDLRVTVIGNKVFPVEINARNSAEIELDWRRAHPEDLIYKSHSLPRKIEEMCVELTKVLGLNFGAIDLILTSDEEYVFLEINPNGQWAWIQQLNPEIKLREALADLLINRGN